MPFEEDEVFPTPHAQQDLSQQGEMLPMLRIDRNLRRRSEWNLVSGHVVLDIDHGQCATGAAWRVDEASRS